MRVEFANDGLARICTNDAHKMGLPISVIRKARDRLLQIEAAKDERDLRNLKSLNYKKRKGGDDETRSIRVNDQFRIFFTLENRGAQTVAVITEIGDPH